MIEQGLTTSFKVEILEGVHDLLTDQLKIALYNGNANIGYETTVYTSVNEIVGTGYTAGGLVLQNVSVQSSGQVAYVSFDNVVWTGVVFTCRGALIYNQSKGNKSVAVLNFGAEKTTTPAQTFTITLPPDTVNSAVIRLS
jgi:hypothetical protein